MNKLIVAFVLGFLLTSFICSIFDGASSIGATRLSATLSSTATSMTVIDTTGFYPTNGVIFIEAEKISYSTVDGTHFYGLIRGFESTTATFHSANKTVYGESSGVINMALGYSPAAIATSNGYTAAVLIPWNFFIITMPKLILWNFPALFPGDWVLLRYLLMSIGICFYIAFAINLGTVITNALVRR